MTSPLPDRRRGDERAVSDAIGFVLVFGIIISMVAVVFVGGFDSLDNARQYERMNNAERAFEVFADNIEDMTQRGAPSRATEVKLDEATLKSGPTRTIEVNVTRANTHSKNLSISYDYRPVVYQSETQPSDKMIYALGATFRASRGGTTMSTEPQWILNDSRVIIPVIQTNHRGGGNVTGSKTVLIRTAAVQRNVDIANTTHESDVWINVTTPRAEAWRDYMEREGLTCPSGLTQDADEAHCQLEEVEVVYVVYFQVNYEFE